MARQGEPTTRSGFLARLRGGPDDGALVHVAPVAGGAPPDFFHAGPDDPGIYMLAGLPHEDGSLPYWFVSSLPSTVEEPGPAARTTRTLISLAAGDGTLKVWHQHGDGSAPMRLRAEPPASSRVPQFIGRAYVCAECEDSTVISLPEG